jgi:hypothetical protein
MNQTLYEQGKRYGTFHSKRLPYSQVSQGDDIEKNPSLIDRHSDRNYTTEPIAAGVIWEYIVPINRRARIIAATVSVLRIIAVVNNSENRIGLQRAENVNPQIVIASNLATANVIWLLYASLRTGTVGDRERQTLPQPFDLFAGDRVFCYQEDIAPNRSSFMTSDFTAFEFTITPRNI